MHKKTHPQSANSTNATSHHRNGSQPFILSHKEFGGTAETIVSLSYPPSEGFQLVSILVASDNSHIQGHVVFADLVFADRSHSGSAPGRSSFTIECAVAQP